MQTSTTTFSTVEDHINSFPTPQQALLRSIRQVIQDEAPEAQESIAYKMPAYTLNGPLIYFALFEHHLGLYSTPEGISAFESDLKKYKQGKGSVQFPLIEPLPLDLIRRIVRQRVVENKVEPKKK